MRRLTNKEILELVHLAQNNDTLAKEKLIINYKHLINSLTNRYKNSSVENEDLFQIGVIGLLKAVENFDNKNFSNFSRYAIPCIVGEIKRHFRDSTWDVKVPRYVKELYKPIEQTIEKLYIRLERSPTIDEISKEVGIDKERVLEVLELKSGYKTLSYDVPSNKDDTLEGITYLDTIGNLDFKYTLEENKIVLNNALKKLSSKEIEVLDLLFFKELTQQEVADKLKVSQMSISRLKRSSLVKLRNFINSS